MLKTRISLVALAMIAATQAQANDQAESKGFVEDSQLNVLLRNAYMNRDYKDGNKDKSEWGQAAIGTFSSGFTQGTVGVGVDAFGLYAVRLDGGKGHPARKGSTSSRKATAATLPMTSPRVAQRSSSVSPTLY